jgi:tRNA uridine 5-carboxymethylaminomethyl modification enzyme
VQYPSEFEVIVVGGGHAGTEAALAAARLGCRTLLLTDSIETLGQMSQSVDRRNWQGHLVKEIDALGGAMAIATDESFNSVNNSSKPAVRATRAQADRLLYKKAVVAGWRTSRTSLCFSKRSTTSCSGNRAVGVVTQMGIRFRGKLIVLTAGNSSR